MQTTLLKAVLKVPLNSNQSIIAKFAGVLTKIWAKVEPVVEHIKCRGVDHYYIKKARASAPAW